MKRVDSVYFETEIKGTESNKQFVILMSKSTTVTKKRKRESTSFMGVSRNFSRGDNVGVLFIIFKWLTISVRSNIILYWANICFGEHGYFQWIINFVNYIINIQSYQTTNKTHFIQIASCLPAVPLLWNVASAREWDFTAQQFWWSCVFAHLSGNTADDAIRAVVSGGASGARPHHLKSVPPFHVWPPGCCIHPIQYFKNVPPLLVSGPSYFLAPPAAKSWRRAWMQCKWTFTKRFILSTLQRKCPMLR